jgi:hypothetical protein
MKPIFKIGLGLAALAAVITGGVKGVSAYNKLKDAVGNFNFAFAFLRIHGLIGEGITKFTSPTIRVLFNLNLKNFTGFDIQVTKIYARIEMQKAGSKDWSVIATPTGYLDLNLKDGKEENKTLTFDFKSLATITSLINKNNRHRVYMTYQFKGQAMNYTTDLDLTGPISTYWTKIKSSFPALKGVEDLAI